MLHSPEPPRTYFFHRPELAGALADQVLDTTLGASGGMFLAAPRRTGKSTFVRQDLVPEFERRGLNVIYVDLWIDKTANPAVHIANAIRTEHEAAMHCRSGPSTAKRRKRLERRR